MSPYCSRKCRIFILKKIRKKERIRKREEKEKIRIRQNKQIKQIKKKLRQKRKIRELKQIRQIKKQLKIRNKKKIITSKKQEKIKKQNIIKKEDTSFYGFSKLRFEIFARDRFCCIYCGRNSLKDRVVLELEHIIPRSISCEVDLRKILKEHLATSCRECNIGKGNTLLDKENFKEIVSELRNRLNI